MNANDIGSVEIAAAFGGTMTVGTAIFLLLQIVKGFWPDLNGRAAEAAVLIVSGLAAVMLLFAVSADWTDSTTYLSLAVAMLSSTVIARGVFSQLFKVSVSGSPPSSEAEATVVDDPQAEPAAEVVNKPKRRAVKRAGGRPAAVNSTTPSSSSAPGKVTEGIP